MKPLSAYGYILFGELVAILSVTEHLITNNSQIQQREKRNIFGHPDSSGNNHFQLGISPLPRYHQNSVKTSSLEPK